MSLVVILCISWLNEKYAHEERCLGIIVNKIIPNEETRDVMNENII